MQMEKLLKKNNNPWMRGLQGVYVLQTVNSSFVMKDGALRVLNARLCTQRLNTQGKGHPEY